MQGKYFVGIDVSKNTLDFCVLASNQVVMQAVVENNLSAIRDFIGKLKKDYSLPDDTIWCMENTGVYGNLLVAELYKSGFFVWVENPVQIKLSQGMVRDKSDKIDAKRIALYAQTFAHKARLYTPLRAVVKTLQKLMGTRDILIKSKVGIEKNISEASRFLDKETARLMKSNTKAALNGLKKDIASIEQQIFTLIKQDQRLNHLNQLVQSVEGVGPVTAAVLIVTTNEFKDFKCPKKYNCYAGLAPFQQQSGSSIRTRNRVSHKANKKVKSLLHMAAMSCVANKTSEFREYYDRKTKEGKNGMAVINAIRAKLIARVFACVRDEKMYQKRLRIISN